MYKRIYPAGFDNLAARRLGSEESDINTFVSNLIICSKDEVRIINGYFHDNLNKFDMDWTLSQDGNVIRIGEPYNPVNLEPGQNKVIIRIPFNKAKSGCLVQSTGCGSMSG